MNLKTYLNKNVILIDKENNTYKGYVGDYIFPEDNEDGIESIVLEVELDLLEFSSNFIKSIKEV